MLIKMIDGGILDVRYHSESWGGCETCDYGSSYVREFWIDLTGGTIHIETEEMYNYAISEGFMMATFLQNVEDIKSMTENQFYHWLEDKVRGEVGSSLDTFELQEK
jgi:hypothetical protein